MRVRPVGETRLLDLPYDVLFHLMTESGLEPRDLLNLRLTSKKLAESMALDIHLGALFGRKALNTRTVGEARAIFNRAHAELLHKAVRAQVLGNLQRRWIDDAAGLPTEQRLSAAELLLTDNAAQPSNRQFDFSDLEKMYVEHALWPQLQDDPGPVNETVNRLPFPLGPRARLDLERHVIEDFHIRRELENPDTPRADHFIDRWGIETEDIQARVEQRVCAFDMPAGEMAWRQEREPDEIADDYGIRADAPDAPNAARALLRRLYDTGPTDEDLL